MKLQAEYLLMKWARVRDGTLSREQLRPQIQPWCAEIEQLLGEGASCGHAKTHRSCKKILKLALALWTFLELDDVEPTNSPAE